MIHMVFHSIPLFWRLVNAIRILYGRKVAIDEQFYSLSKQELIIF